MHGMTLVDQFVQDQAKSPGATGELSTILNRISLAGRLIAAEIMKAGFVGKLGLTGQVNVQGEEVRALDIISNDIFIEVFSSIGAVHGMASEEMDEELHYQGDPNGRYMVLHDPLDGSGNVNVNGSMGTIFGVHERKDPGAEPSRQDYYRQGRDLVAAGYILYGPATVFVYTAGGPVHGFTLDRSVGSFFLTHPDMKFAEGGGAYSVNEGNQSKWEPNVAHMVETFRKGESKCGKRSARYVGALVADFHRTLIQGGVYMYPPDKKNTNGKLRLLYEAAPLSFIAEKAGGLGHTGTQPVLDVEPNDLHQRVPLYIGSKPDVEEVVRLLDA